MKKTRELNTNKGITLIALVITIIVMLILVGVTISMAVNGGLFDYAGKAVGDTKNALDAEGQLANGDIIEYYLNRKPAVTSLKEYSEELLNEDGVLDENTRYESGYNTAVIPKGFYLSEEETEQSIAGGLVIKDASGNEFVWIPVKDGEFERTGWWENEPTDKTIDEITEDWEEEDYMQAVAECEGYDNAEEAAKEKGFEDENGNGDTQAWLDDNYETWEEFFKNDYGYMFGALSENYAENANNDPMGEYDNMVASVQKYGGFYIGRYEAGSTTPRKFNTSNGTTTLGVKKGLYPYNYVVWGASMTNYEDEYTSGSNNYGHGAVYLSKNMYTGEEYGVTSTLCYGVQWDATLRFIKDKVNVTNSTQWGNYANHEFTFTGEYSTDSGTTWLDATNMTKPIASEENEWTTYLLTTGASETNKAKNIYDLAGNVYEWTMEAYSSTYRVNRGGSYDNRGGLDPASYRNSGFPSSCYSSIGFRPTLYIK